MPFRFQKVFQITYFLPERNWRASNAERRIHTPKGGAQPVRMNSHARKLPRGQKPPGSHPRDTARTLAAGLERDGYITTLKDLSSCTLGSTQTPEGHARQTQDPVMVTQSTPIGSQGPNQAGGQAPPFHRVTKSRQGEFKGIPGHMILMVNRG